MQIKGITIHNTGNRLSAEEMYNYLRFNGKLNLCHFLVDESKIIQTTDLNEMSYHTGKGYDMGNRHTISIEICRSTSPLNLYLKAQSKAIRLIKSLMKQYHLTRYDIYFHNDFDKKTNCPHRIIEKYKNKNNFIREEFTDEL